MTNKKLFKKNKNPLKDTVIGIPLGAIIIISLMTYAYSTMEEITPQTMFKNMLGWLVQGSWVGLGFYLLVFIGLGGLVTYARWGIDHK